MDPYLSEIRLFPYNFPMTGWATCDGSLLPVQQNQALFVLLGNVFGGDGRTTFALPDMRGRLPVNQGFGPSGASYLRGQVGGAENVQLLNTQVPQHNHSLYASTDTTSLVTTDAGAFLGNPANQSPADNSGPNNLYTTEYVPVQLSPNAVAAAGGNQAHNNCMPSLALRFCIATIGIFPSRN